MVVFIIEFIIVLHVYILVLVSINKKSAMIEITTVQTLEYTSGGAYWRQD
jgi:hypothetical protein